MRRLIAATAAGSLAVAAALFGALPASAADPAEVYVVHGIPGLPVDVYVNGALTLDDFQPETVAGPLDLPAGSYEIAITAADAADASAPVLTATADVAAGNSYSLVAHLDADGNPTVTTTSPPSRPGKPASSSGMMPPPPRSTSAPVAPSSSPV